MTKAEAITILTKYALRSAPKEAIELEELYSALGTVLPDKPSREAAKETARLYARANHMQLVFTKILGL